MPPTAAELSNVLLRPVPGSKPSPAKDPFRDPRLVDRSRLRPVQFVAGHKDPLPTEMDKFIANLQSQRKKLVSTSPKESAPQSQEE